ncbi:hypothetical protein CSUI_001006 [Cystoisospora suis]|uniref:SRS domain-containing protein n=1 Tax=Cystoisospora suis TaxID=483139 RepID=A0A2C6KM96_9APIC|nr:hypothetical protein CSUI_001006 [Cystoisospora suis]
MAVSGPTTRSHITARSSDFRRRRSVFFVLGTAGLAVVLPLFLQGKVPTAAAHGELAELYPGHPRRLAAKPVPVCGANAEGKQNGKNLELTAKDGLQFKCAAAQTLHPPSTTQNDDFDQVYEYDKATSTCKGDGIALNSVVTGAKLTRSTQNSLPAAKSAETVYTLSYTGAPTADKSLCYTCKTSSPSPGDGRASQQAVECTVHITVKAKTPPSPPGGSQQGDTPAPPVNGTTTPPTSTSTSDSRRIAASAAATAATFLPVVFFL